TSSVARWRSSLATPARSPMQTSRLTLRSARARQGGRQRPAPRRSANPPHPIKGPGVLGTSGLVAWQALLGAWLLHRRTAVRVGAAAAGATHVAQCSPCRVGIARLACISRRSGGCRQRIGLGLEVSLAGPDAVEGAGLAREAARVDQVGP